MKKTARLVLAAFLSLALVAGTVISAAAAPPPHAQNNKLKEKQPKPQRQEKPNKFKHEFSDWDDNYWAADALGRMILRAIIVGDGGAIHPQRHVTRLEALITLFRLYDYTETDYVDGEFDDDVPEWGLDAFLAGLNRGLVKPLNAKGKSFGLDHKLSRLDAAVLLVRAAGLEADAEKRAGETLGFKDYNSIPADLRGYVAVAVENDFIKGYPNGVFQGNKLVTRAEWTALLARLEDKQPPSDDDEDDDEKTEVRGTITAVTTGSTPALTVQENDEKDAATYRFAAEHELFLDGQPAKPADIKTGDTVWLFLDADGNIAWASVTSKAERVVTGKIVSTTDIGQRQSIVLDTGAAEVSYDLADDVLIDEEGTLFNLEIPFSALQAGDTVTATIVDGKALIVTRTARAIAQVELEGTITAVSVDGQYFTLRVESDDDDTEDVTIAFTATTEFTLNGVVATATDLVIGAKAEVKASQESNRYTASAVDLEVEIEEEEED